MLYFQVTQLLNRYSRGVDRRDWTLLRSVFHSDSVDEHGLSAGNVDTFIEGFADRSAKVTEMMHLNSNIIIAERNPDRREVLVETSCVAWSRVLPDDMVPGSFYDTPLIAPASGHARVVTVANRYLDLLAEREGELKILFRRVIFEWVTVSEAERELPFGPGLARSSRSSSDPGYRSLDEFREEYLSRRAVVHPTLP
jgi:hypothetical protein